MCRAFSAGDVGSVGGKHQKGRIYIRGGKILCQQNVTLSYFFVGVPLNLTSPRLDTKFCLRVRLEYNERRQRTIDRLFGSRSIL